MGIRFGTDGIRGLANDQLTAEIATALGRAAAVVFPGVDAVVGRDTRRSGQMLESAVTAGLCSQGADVVIMGVVPTPAVAAASVDCGRLGVMISASHNPFADNGIKLFAPGGRKLSDSQQAEIELIANRILESGSTPGPTGAGIGVVSSDGSLLDHYLEGVSASLDGRTLDGMSVVVDCANGSNSVVGPKLLKRLGAQVRSIGDEPDGININEGSGSTDTSKLSRVVQECGADLGIAFDGDADRLIAVDQKGALIDGDRIIALCALDMRDRGLLAHDTVVVTVMSNLGLIQAMDKAGITVIQTAVGDRHVLEELARGGYSLGGEQSGHIVFSDLATTGDGLLAGVVLMDLVKRAGRQLGDLADCAMKVLPQVLVNVTVSGDAASVVRSLEDEIAAVDSELGTGGRVLVRPSGTEPLVRVMVEADDRVTALSVAERVASRVNQIAGT